MKLSFTPLWKFWKQPRNRWLLSILWVLLIGSLAFFWYLGSTGLIDETEPLFAEAARQMTVTGDWITPYFNGATRFDKPPLVYWLMAIAYKLIGVNEWAVRLPSAISAIALTGLGFYTLRRFGFPRPVAEVQGRGKDLPTTVRLTLTEAHYPLPTTQSLWLSAWIGAALIALNPITITWARTGVSDMLLTGCMGSALLCFFIGYATEDTRDKEQDTKKEEQIDKAENFPSGRATAGGLPLQPTVLSPWYLAFYVLVALAILAKGPVGIVLPGLIISTFVLYLGNWRQMWREMKPLWGGLIVAAIAMPWYVLVIWQNGEAYIDSFFGYHNVQRFTSVVNRHSAPWYFYFLVVLVGFAPWSSFLPLAIARLRFWERKHWQAAPRSTQLGLFAFFWFASIFGFFTIAVTKLPSYVLPLMPAAAILVALLWSDRMSGRQVHPHLQPLSHQGRGEQRRNFLPAAIVLSGLFNVLLLLALAGVIFYSPSLVGYDPAVPDLQQLLQQSGLPVRGGIVWTATAVATVLLLRRRDLQCWLWLPNLLGFVAFAIVVLTPGYFLVDQARQMPLRQLAAIAVQQQRKGEELIMIGFDKPSLVFYTQRPVRFFPNAPEGFTYIQQVATTPTHPPSVLVLSEIRKLRKIVLAPDQYQDLGKTKAYRLMRIFKR